MGISTLMAGMSLHNMMFNSDFRILVIATKQDVAKNLVAKVKLAWDLLPAFLKQGIEVVNNNKLEIAFSNGSSIKAVSSSPDAARSEALSLLLIDECIEYHTEITVLNKNTNTIETINIGVLFDKLNSNE